MVSSRSSAPPALPSDVDTVCCSRVLQGLRQDTTGGPHHPHCGRAEQGTLILHQLPPETSIGPNERPLLQNYFMSPTEAEAFEPANTEWDTVSRSWTTI